MDEAVIATRLVCANDRINESVSREGLAPIVKANSRLILVDGLVL